MHPDPAPWVTPAAHSAGGPRAGARVLGLGERCVFREPKRAPSPKLSISCRTKISFGLARGPLRRLRRSDGPRTAGLRRGPENGDLGGPAHNRCGSLVGGHVPRRRAGRAGGPQVRPSSILRPLRRDRPWWGIAVGVILFGLALAARWTLGGLAEGFGPMLLLPSILLTGVLGGIRIGLATAAISLLVAWTWFFPPYGT